MMMTREKSVTVSLLSAVAFVAYGLAYASTAASAQDAASFYKGKVITLVTSSRPGGGFDTYARLVAPHLEQKTGATVVVANVRGGEGIVARNQVYSAKPDGLTLAIVNGLGGVQAQLTEQRGVRHDLKKFSWIARVSTMANHVWLVNSKSRYRSVQDFLNSPRPIKLAAPGKTGGIGSVQAVMCKALNLNCKIVIGYRSNAVPLAVISGEADAFATSADSAKRYAQGGELVAFASLVRERSPYFPDVPTIFEQVDLTPDKAWWIDFHAKMGKIGRAFAAPPGMPEDRIGYLRQVFAKILSDPKFIAEAKKVGREVHYLPAHVLEEYTRELLGPMDANKLKEVRHVLLQAYY